MFLNSSFGFLDVWAAVQSEQGTKAELPQGVEWSKKRAHVSRGHMNN